MSVYFVYRSHDEGPSGKLIRRLDGDFRLDVRVDQEGNKVNGKIPLEMTGLAAECGTMLDLEADGPDGEEFLAALSDLVASGFQRTEEVYLPQSRSQ